MVQVFQVAPAVQEFQGCLFLENLVNQLIQVVPVAQYHLVLNLRKHVNIDKTAFYFKLG